MDLLNRVIIPSILMVIATAFLINSVRKLRMGEFTDKLSHSNEENGHREIRLAIMSITLNIIYVALTLPLPVSILFGDYVSDFFLFFNFYLFCFSYSINFYVLLAMNRLFRSEFLLIFKNILKKQNINQPIDLDFEL
jgi:hypothetical protein